MITYDFTKQPHTGLVTLRTHPSPAPGWVDGVYRWREPVVEPLPAGQSTGPIRFTTSHVTDTSEALEPSDPNSAGTYTYINAPVLTLPADAKTYRTTLTASNPGASDASFIPVINDLAFYEPFTVPAGGEPITVTFDAILSKRLFDLTFRAAPGTPEPATLDLHAIAMEPVETTPREHPHVYVISDSITQTYFDHERPQAGWGEELFRYLFPGRQAVIQRDFGGSAVQSRTISSADGTLVIHNRALGGRSSKSYINEGRLNEVLREIRAGDYLIFQMGPNDASRNRPMRYEGLEGYLDWVDRYMVSAADRGVIPFIVSPTPTYAFTGEHELRLSFGDYGKLAMQYAREHGIAHVDLGEIGRKLAERLGRENGRILHMKISAGQYGNFPDGVDDSTHLSRLGAHKYAGIVAKGFAESFPEHFNFTPDPALDPVPAPTDLTAQVENDGRKRFGRATKLRWTAVPGAEYYRVVRRDETGAEVFRTVTMAHWYYDMPQPGQSDTAVYEVTAWQEDRSSAPATITVTHHFDLDATPDTRITGVNLYEIDQTTFPGKIAFSVRFAARPDADRYRIVMVNTATNETKVLAELREAQVDGLHSFRVNRETTLTIHVEGSNANGDQYRSDAVALPWRD